jgi:HPt (histidine-containing phosphotransfer) domain-containing protein
VRRYESLTDKQLADAVAEKSATAHTERSAAALLGIPAHVAMAKRIEEQIAELKSEQSRRAASD